MPSQLFADKAEGSKATKATQNVVLDSELPAGDLELVAAALAKLEVTRQRREGEDDKPLNRPDKGKSKDTPASSTINRYSRAFRRQQARKRGKSKRDNNAGPEEEEANYKDDPEERQKLDFWGFLPDDEPLSSTDSEAEDPVQEREERVLRSRKRQLKHHLAEAIDEDEFPNWEEVIAQARILEMKWIDDDVSHFEERAASKGVSWLKETLHSTWLSDSHTTITDIEKKYGKAIKEDHARSRDYCAEQAKAMVLAKAMRKDLMMKFAQGLEAMSPGEDDGSGNDWFVGAQGYQVVDGPGGMRCIGVKLPKKIIKEWGIFAEGQMPS